MSPRDGPPDSWYEPPDEPDAPELPQPDEECSVCGKTNWGEVEKKGDEAVAACQELVPCENCSGTGVIRVDENGAVDDQEDITEEERVALLLAGAKCPECDGAKTVTCEGAWSKNISPDDEEDDHGAMDSAREDKLFND